MLHWASLIIFFGLSVLALWTASTLLQKNGIYFFCIVASIVAGYFAKVDLFQKVFSVQMVIIPVILLALLITYLKYGKSESIRLFIIVTVSQVVMFVLRFFEYAFLDIFNGVYYYMTWNYLSSFVGTMIAFALSCVAGYFFISYVDMKKVTQIIRNAIYLVIVSAIDSIIFITIAYSGYFAFVDIFLTLLLYFAFDLVLCILLSCYEILANGKQQAPEVILINKKPKEKKQETAKTSLTKQEEKDSKISSYFDKKQDNKTTSNSQTTTKNNSKNDKKSSFLHKKK